MMKPPRVCACGSTVPAGKRCACQAVFDRARGGARQRGYDVAYQRAAAAFLAEPGHERCDCGRPATLVRHVVSIRQRPDLRMARTNWRPGCASCNAKDAARDRRERRATPSTENRNAMGAGPSGATTRDTPEFFPSANSTDRPRDRRPKIV